MSNIITPGGDSKDRASRSVTFIAVAAMLVSCGGGGGGGTVIGGGGIGGTGISQGTVTGVGSIDLNGSVFTTTNDTPVAIDDQTGTFASLRSELERRIGSVATVKVTFANASGGTANEIALKDNLQGKITTTDCATGTITAMGKTIIVDASTKFQPAGITCASLSANDLIEVSGVEDNDRILASFVERKGTFQPGVTEVEVKGTISNLAGNTFDIGNLKVNVLPGTTVIDNSLGALANGQTVEVKGNSYAAGNLNASKIEAFVMGISARDNERVELEGLVAKCTGVPCTSFTIGDKDVSITATTKFKDGLNSDLVNGRKVEVEGLVQGGKVVAEKVEFKSAGSGGGGSGGGGSSVKIEAAADDAGNASTNSFQVLGITIKANALTEFKGGISNAGDIVAGDGVDVRGYANGASEVIAAEIAKQSGGGNQRVTLQGPIASQNAGGGTFTFAILGVPVKANGATKLTGSHGNAISSNDVLRAPAGTLVKARGTENPPNQIDATGTDGEVDLQN
jgi:hypothetical protein